MSNIMKNSLEIFNNIVNGKPQEFEEIEVNEFEEENEIMTKAEVKTLIEKHNNEIDNYINNILPSELGKKDNTATLTMGEWFKAQELIQKQEFYKKGRAIQLPLRERGYDVKMDMQSNKLILY